MREPGHVSFCQLVAQSKVLFGKREEWGVSAREVGWREMGRYVMEKGRVKGGK